MRSHEYGHTFRELIQIISPPLIPAVLFALAMHAGAALQFLPQPYPALDTDRTILLHQAAASQTKQPANVLLMGDSSCLMNVPARALEAALPNGHRVLNLGTLSYLDLEACAAMLRNFSQSNPNQLRAVVLLLHPEALRRPGPDDFYVEVLHRFWGGQDYCHAAIPDLLCWAGAEIFRGRCLARIWPVPLHGEYGRFYGFSFDLAAFLAREQGSAIDPRTLDLRTIQGNAEYRLVPSLERASQVFREAVPEGVLLLAGITPAPASFVLPAYQEQYESMLKRWTQWLQTARGLTELPATLPDNQFASTTHLNEGARRAYTEILARALVLHLSKP